MDLKFYLKERGIKNNMFRKERDVWMTDIYIQYCSTIVVYMC